VRHGKPPRLWPSVLGLLAVACVIAAIVLLFIYEPGVKATPSCRYASGSVAVEVDGPDCGRVLRALARDSDRAWITTSAPQGSVYAQLVREPDVVRIYDHGEPEFARALSGYLQKAGWAVVAPSPAPA